jgi:hypothetical protein
MEAVTFRFEWCSRSLQLQVCDILPAGIKSAGVENGPNRFRPGRLSDVALTWFNVRVVKIGMLLP